jgi:penicillin-binding protein 1C
VLLRGPNARAEVVARRACVLAERINAPSACAPAQRLVMASLDRPSSATLGSGAPCRASVAPSGGRAVVSTLDAEAQRILLGALKRPGLGEAAGVIVDNGSGDILAYAGGGRRPADLIAQPRNVGNLLQPFAYGLALERRLLTAASLVEEPLSNHAPTVPDDRSWVNVRQALAGGMADPAQTVVRMLGDGLAERLRQADLELPRGNAQERPGSTGEPVP